MLLFNLTSALMLVIVIAFPIAREMTMDWYRSLGVMLPGLTETMLSPRLPWLLLGIFITRLWLHAVLRKHLPSHVEGGWALAACIGFVLLTILAFFMPLITPHDGPLGRLD